MMLPAMRGDKKMPEFRNDFALHLILFLRFAAAEIGGQI